MLDAATAVRTSFLQWLLETDDSRRGWYNAYRQYYDGDHDTQLTDRQRNYLELKLDEEFNDNLCPIVVDAMAERLAVTGFTTDNEALDQQLWDWWAANRMDAEQGKVHLAAGRDGDAYVVVEWDEAERRPRIVFEPAYDGSEGTEVRYESEARHQPAYGLKYWRIGADRPGDAGYRRRLNVYYPDHVEKYVSDQRDKGGDWQPYDEEQGIAVAGDDIQWPEWVGKDGSPLGIPVVHFRNRDQGWNYGQSELKSVVPLQNALNKALIDLLAAADTSAFQILYMLGDDPSDIELTPGAFVYSSKPDVKVGAIPGASLGQLVDLKDAVAMDIARVSRTPLSFFQISRQRAAEGTLKQEEAGLVARAQRAQVGYGNAWEDAMRLCIRLSNAYGGTSFPEDVQISTQWAEAETRNETAHMEELRAKRELGVPIERLWAEAGYSPDEIEDMKASEEYQARVAMLRMGTELGGEAENG